MKTLLKINNPIFYITNDPERAIGLENLLPNYHIICIDKTTLTEEMIKQGVKVFCLEKELGKLNPIYRNSNRLLKHKLVKEYIKKNTPKGKTPYIQVFKIAPNIERTAEKEGYKLLNTEAKLNRKFENKIPQFKAFGELGFFPKTVITRLKDKSFSELQNELSKQLVLQFNRGHTGESTVFLENQQHYEQIQNKFPKREVRISQLIKGSEWTLNACQTKYGTFYGGLSYQITGIPECTTQKGGTVGNDWFLTRNLPKKVFNQIDKITTSVGKKMGESGYRGLFGLDFVIDNNYKVWLIEVNARQPASTSMHTQLLLKSNLPPLSLFHILEFMYPEQDYLRNLNFIPRKTTSKEYKNKYNLNSTKPINAAQLFIRNTKDKSITLKNSIPAGLYDYLLKKTKNAYQINKSNDQNPLVFSFNKGHEIKTGREIARIQTTKSIVNENGKLYNDYLELVKIIKKRIT